MIKVGDVVRFKEEQCSMSYELSRFYEDNKEENFKVADVNGFILQLEGDYQGFINSDRFIKLDLEDKKKDNKIERAVGDVFEVEGVKLQVVEKEGCYNCFFNENLSCIWNKCDGSERKNETSVIFLEVKEESENENLKEEIKSNNLIMEAQEKEIERLEQIIISQDEEKEIIAKREYITFENYSDNLRRLNEEIEEQKQEIEKLDNQLRNHRLTLEFALKL